MRCRPDGLCNKTDEPQVLPSDAPLQMCKHCGIRAFSHTRERNGVSTQPSVEALRELPTLPLSGSNRHSRPDPFARRSIGSPQPFLGAPASMLSGCFKGGLHVPKTNDPFWLDPTVRLPPSNTEKYKLKRAEVFVKAREDWAKIKRKASNAGDGNPQASIAWEEAWSQLGNTLAEF